MGSSGSARTFCGLSADWVGTVADLDSTTWLTYAQAAKRTGRAVNTIRQWRLDGMPMVWRTRPTGSQYRVVDEQVLLAFARRKTSDTNHPVEVTEIESDEDDDLLREVVESLRLAAGGAEFRALQEALETETPACDGITAFVDTSRAIEDDQREIMESICWRCPVLEKCRAFAEVARPDGFWAGRRWPHARITRTHAA